MHGAHLVDEALVPVGHEGDPVELASWVQAAQTEYAKIINGTNVSAGPVTTWSNQLTPETADIQKISYSTDWTYVDSSGLASYVMGPWFNGASVFPNYPKDQNVKYRFDRTPAPATTKTATALGINGLWVNGVALFNMLDAYSYNTSTSTDVVNGPGYWNRDANYAEKATFDHSNAHQPQSGQYHYHQNPTGLRYQMGDNISYVGNADLFPYETESADGKTDWNSISRQTPAALYDEATTNLHHSPILGWARDGYPIYGPYGYSNPNDATSTIERLDSSYRLRSITQRTSLPGWAAQAKFGDNVVLNANGEYTLTSSQYGPSVTANNPLGKYIEDYEFVTGLGDLDKYNGRFAKTPEYPNGTYAYFVSINAAGDGVYPYVVGRQFYGTPSGGVVTSVTESVTTYFDHTVTQNTPPTISDVGNQTTNEDTSTVAIPFTISDAETAAGSLVVTAASSNTTLVPTGSVVLGGSGANRTVTVTPAANASGTTTITLTVRDATGATASDSFVVTVLAVNDAPVASNDAAATNGTTSVSINVLANDTDVDSASLTVSLASNPTNGTAVVGANGTITYTANAGFTGTDSFTYRLSDGQATSNTATVSVSVGATGGTKFFVVDSTADATFRYLANGSFSSRSATASGNTNPMGVAASPDGSTLWVIDGNRTVHVYDAAMVRLGSWTVSGLQIPTGIAVIGNDLWLVDSATDRAYLFTGGASRRSGTATASRSFALGAGNTNPQDIVADATNLWVVHAGTTDQVFVYQASTGARLGVWTIDSQNSNPTGITLDPTGASSSLWLVDNVADRVFEYSAGRQRTSGSQTAALSFALNSGNGNPQGIADPLPYLASQADSEASTTAQAFDAAIASLSDGREWTAIRNSAAVSNDAQPTTDAAPPAPGQNAGRATIGVPSNGVSRQRRPESRSAPLDSTCTAAIDAVLSRGL